MDFILDVYRVERAALDADQLGTPEHLELRQTKSKASWPPSMLGCSPSRAATHRAEPMGEAINYALGQWNDSRSSSPTRTCPSTTTPPKTRSVSRPSDERTSSSLGNDHAGENLAGLYSLIATCEVNGVNPVAYLADVLLRVQTHPASRIDELLPHRWAPTLPAPP